MADKRQIKTGFIMGARELDQISRREAPFDDMQRGIARGRRDSDHSDDSGRHCSSLTPSYDRIVPYALGIGIAPATVNGKVAPLYPTDLFKWLPKRRDIGLRFCIVLSES